MQSRQPVRTHDIHGSSLGASIRSLGASSRLGRLGSAPSCSACFSSLLLPESTRRSAHDIRQVLSLRKVLAWLAR